MKLSKLRYSILLLFLSLFFTIFPFSGNISNYLRSGTYHITQGQWQSTWKITVVNGSITGTSEWTCCPGHRVDPLRGKIEGNRVIIERDCSKQGYGSVCKQTYVGYFNNGKISGPCSGTGLTNGSTWTMVLTNPEPVFGSATYEEYALKGDIYFFPVGTNHLPDFSRLSPVGSIYARELNVSIRPFTQGFPGITKRFEWFGIRYRGNFRLNGAGNYKFRLNSDDGSKLWIDNKLVIDNDGLHPVGHTSKSGNIYLSNGKHYMVVEFFQGPRAMLGLQLYVTPPGGQEEIFHPDYLSNKSFPSNSGYRGENVWVINNAHGIFHWSGKGWKHVSYSRSNATDIGVGSNGTVWMAGVDLSTKGPSIYRWMDNIHSFVKVPGNAVKVDVNHYGIPWIVTISEDIFHWSNRRWNKVPGKAKDIGVGPNGDVFIIGTKKMVGGYQIFKWKGNGWQLYPGAAVRIDVDRNGNPWVINENGNIYKWNGMSWELLPGLAVDISSGPKTVWVIGTDNVPGGHGIYRWDEQIKNWEKVPGGAVAISVGGISVK